MRSVRLLLPLLALALFQNTALSADPDSVTAVSPSEKVRANASGNSISVFDAATDKELFRIKGHTDNITALQFAPDGKTLASGAKDQTVCVWDAQTGKKLIGIRLAASVRTIGFSPDGKTMSVLVEGKTLHIFDAATGKETMTIKVD